MRAKPKSKSPRAINRRRVRPARPNHGYSSEEFRYLVEHCAELEQYRGEWLLLQGYGLAAHSADFSEIKAMIARRDIQSPFTYYVPKEDESNFLSI